MKGENYGKSDRIGILYNYDWKIHLVVNFSICNFKFKLKSIKNQLKIKLK